MTYWTSSNFAALNRDKKSFIVLTVSCGGVTFAVDMLNTNQLFSLQIERPTLKLLE